MLGYILPLLVEVSQLAHILYISHFNQERLKPRIY